MSVDRHTVVRVLIRDRMKLFGYILSIVRDVHMAEDVFQDLSIVVVDKCDEINDPDALPAWMRKAARFKSLRALERHSARPQSLDDSMLDLMEADWASFDTTEASDLTDALRHCMGELTENNMRIVRLRYVDGLKSGQIADELGRNAQAVYVALGRIHKQLANCIEARLDAEGGGHD